MLNNASLKTKVLLSAAITGLIAATILGIVIYNTSIVPIKNTEKDRIVSQVTEYINAQINLKVQGGILGSSALSIQDNVSSALEVEDREEIIPAFKGIRDQFRNQTNYKNIKTHLITADGRSMVKSWDIDSYGQNVSGNPIIANVIKNKRAIGTLALGGTGVSVIAASPVIRENELMGVVTFIQGLASVRKAFTKEKNGQWILLIDKEFVSKNYGDMPVIAKNTSFTKKYILANNRWFPKEVVSFAQQAFQPIDGDQNQVYSHEDKVLIDIPAYNESQEIFGRHLFIIDEAAYNAPIDAAVQSAQVSLIGIVLAIIALAGIIVFVVARVVINPLNEVKNLMGKIVQTGDFSIRAEVKSKDEVGRTSESINTLLEQIGLALSEVNETVIAVSKGDFSRKIHGQFEGDLAKLKNGINTGSEVISGVMDNLSSAMTAMNAGKYDTKIDVSNSEGLYLDMLVNAQNAFNETNHVIAEINSVMMAMQQGNYEKRVEIDAKGELNTLKEHINESMQSLNSAINDIVDTVTALSEGDLTKTITNKYNGDLLTLKDAINQSISNLSGIVSQVVQSGYVVNNEAANVSSGAGDVRQKIQQQAAAIEETSATMEEMNATVQNNTENAKLASEVVGQVQSESKKAQDVMGKTIEAMNSIKDSSSDIAEIVTLIDSIAFQTNLLALNAAVEAARAGEHGRGFAVVAGEVRSLAQKSADAAKDIKNLIDSSVQRISQGTELASASGEVQKDISESINNVAEMIHQINSASQEQAEGVSQVHQAINEIDSATQANAALVETTSSSADSMSEQAASLNENMAFFKTNQTAKASVQPAKAVSHATPEIAAPKKQSSSKPAVKPELKTSPAVKNTVEKPAEKPAAPARKAPVNPTLQTPPPTQPSDKGDEWSEF